MKKNKPKPTDHKPDIEDSSSILLNDLRAKNPAIESLINTLDLEVKTQPLSLEKQKIIEAFKALDFEALHVLLDDDRPYNEVSKELFLSRLKDKLDQFSDLKSYEAVIEGVCGYCNKGCKAYKFVARDFPSLPLFFEEKNGRVTDIIFCKDLKVYPPDENNLDLYLKFYDDELVNFKPSQEYLINRQKIEKTVEAFNRLESLGLVPIQDVINWYDNTKPLVDELQLDIPAFFRGRDYKVYEHIGSLYSKVEYLVRNYTENHLAQNALAEYLAIDPKNERSVVKWLLDNKNNHFCSLKKTENWKETGILILETEPPLTIDCSDFLEGFLFLDIYNDTYFKITQKYRPKKKHLDQNPEGIEWSLESHLKLYKKYLDLL